MDIHFHDNTRLEGANLIGFVGKFVVLFVPDAAECIAPHEDTIEHIRFEHGPEVEEFRQTYINGWRMNEQT